MLARDGRTVYGGGGNAIVTLARDADTGRLRQLRGPAGGEIDEGAVLTFRRDSSTGAIEPPAPPAGCPAAEDPPTGCHEAAGVSYVLGGLATAGEDTYLASYADSPSIVHLERDEVTGALGDTPGGCLADHRCRPVSDLRHPAAMTLSADGRKLGDVARRSVRLPRHPWRAGLRAPVTRTLGGYARAS